MSAGASTQNNAWAYEYWLDTHVAAHFTTIIHAVIFRVISFLHSGEKHIPSLEKIKSESSVLYLLTSSDLWTNMATVQCHVTACLANFFVATLWLKGNWTPRALAEVHPSWNSKNVCMLYFSIHVLKLSCCPVLCICVSWGCMESENYFLCNLNLNLNAFRAKCINLGCARRRSFTDSRPGELCSLSIVTC